MTLCTEATLVKRRADALKVVTLFCRSWACEICAPRRASQVAKDIKRGFPSKFLTLTVNPAVYGSPEERADRLATAFRKWIRLLRKASPGQAVEYFAVFEKTERGEPHLHIAGRWPYVAQRKISEFFAAELQAPIVDIRAAKSPRGLATYLSKYLSKDCTKFGNLKRYFRSRGWCGPREVFKEVREWRGVKWERSDLSIAKWSELVCVWGWRRTFFDGGGGWEACKPEPAQAPLRGAAGALRA